MLPAEVPALVVGAGPTGSMASLLLEQMGVETLLVERREKAQPAPAAHVVNARTLEICRAAGVDAGALERAALRPSDAAFAYFVTRVGGRVLGRHPYERQGDDQLAVTPTPLRNIPQSRFEPILHEALDRVAERRPAWQVEWVSSVQGPDGVRSTLRDLATGRSHEVRSAWVLAADGAGSPVRKSLGIELDGPQRIQSFIMIHFSAVLRGLPEIPPGLLFFTCDPRSGGGVLVVHDLDREAVFMHPYDPDEEDEAHYDVARCEALVRAAFEDLSVPIEVRHVGAWTMTCQVAQRYREGRIFLVGDAAHRFPPTGGLGLNSGVQDAHNLAWKIAAVHAGWAPASLLESFETERRPVAQRNADQSLRNALTLLQVPRALGIEDLSPEASARMEATLADPEGAARVRAAIDAQAEHFDLSGLQLGFAYDEGALVAETEASTEPSSPSGFTPSGRPGARLPHAWLRSDAAPHSLLDEVPLDRFLLIVGPEGGAWLEHAGDALAALPFDALSADEDRFIDLVRWLAQAGIERSGALLVRPDQHVAWRARRLAPEPAPALATAARQLLSDATPTAD